ncbi:RagB/SusD family nutrient uptake outer membrane protein [Ferruginibacter sp. SUN002]|uniref:RagB/SusD family nutrient uptake outer membrane protein n=1 Tax=Ferruginibacter sp. SUN002 TaxID=2937789 RepID=UPI003D363189
MNLYKKIQRISLPVVIFTLVIVASSSCKKYLDVEPKTIAGNAETIFVHPDTVEKIIYGIYDVMQGDYGLGGNRLTIMYPYDDDCMMSSSAASDLTSRGFYNHFNIFPTYDNVLFKNVWLWFFTGVERANTAIYYIPRMTLYTSGTADEKAKLKRFYGEALTLRAIYLSELVKMWGDIPASFLPASQTPDLYMERRNRFEIYDQILADLDLAANELLPWRDEMGGIDPDRITRGYAKGLRAKIALFAGGYSLNQDGTTFRQSNYLDYYAIAKKETSELMANRSRHTLNPSYKAVFKDAILAHAFEPNGEILFEVSSRFQGGKTGSKLGYDCGPRMTTGTTGNGFIRVSPTYFYMFDSTDERRDVTIAPYKITPTTLVRVPQACGDWYDGKFRRDWITNTSFDIYTNQNLGLNFPLMRFSDVLLMYAEAENELNGPTTSALDAINEVRLRAKAPALTLPGSKAAMFDAIVKERALELGGEAIRRYDLIRWNLMETKLRETKNTLDQIARGINFPLEYSIPAPYDTLPRVMYLKDDVANGGLAAGNSYYHPYKSSDPTIGGYTKINWISSIASSSTITETNPNGMIGLHSNYALGGLPLGNGFGFIHGTHELLPIPTFAITTNPRVTQNHGY